MLDVCFDGRTLWIAPSSGYQARHTIPCLHLGEPARMKKISLKTIRKSLNIKGKEEGDFVMLQQPSMTADFSKEESLFGGCYTKDLAGCDLASEEEKGGQNKGRSKTTLFK